jgi:hypothetical protein
VSAPESPTTAPRPDRQPAEEARLGQHIVSLAASAGEQFDLLALAFNAALALNCQCLFIADRTPPRAFSEAMARRGCDIAEPLASGQFRVVGVDGTYRCGGRFDPDRTLDRLRQLIASARESGRPGVCASGEVTWIHRGVPGVDRWLEYEYRLNELEGLASAAIICLYETTALSEGLAGELKKVHPLVHENGAVKANHAFAADPTHAADVPLVEELEPPADQLPCALLTELLSAYVDGQLAPRRREEVSRHVGACVQCARRLEFYRTVKSRLVSMRTPSDVGPEFWAAVRRRLADPPDSSA